MSAYTTARVPQARAIGAPSKMDGLYLGHEHLMRSPRPGAFDAQEIPSRYGERRVLPSERTVPEAPPRRIAEPVELRSGPRPIALFPSRKPGTTYTPRPGGLPAKLIEHLTQHGGLLTTADVCRMFRLDLAAACSLLKRPVEAGVLIKHKAAGKVAYALPGYVIPAEKQEAADAHA